MSAPTHKAALVKAELLAMEKLTGGSTIKELAKQYDMSPGAVSNALALADKNGFYERAEGLILSRLVSPALAVYEDRILRGDLEAARDILFGTGILSKAPKVDTGGAEALSIEAYRIVRAARQSNNGVFNAEVVERHDNGSTVHREGEQTTGRDVQGGL
jgi:hypothetical protein